MTFFLIQDLHIDSDAWCCSAEEMQEDVENFLVDYGDFYNVEAQVSHAGTGFDVTIDCDHDEFAPEDAMNGTVVERIREVFEDSDIIIHGDFNVLSETDN